MFWSGCYDSSLVQKKKKKERKTHFICYDYTLVVTRYLRLSSLLTLIMCFLMKIICTYFFLIFLKTGRHRSQIVRWPSHRLCIKHRIVLMNTQRLEYCLTWTLVKSSASTWENDTSIAIQCARPYSSMLYHLTNSKSDPLQ